MRALIIDGPRSARVGEVEVPRPAAGQVVVDVHRVGICGTDVELFTGELAYFEQGKSRFPLRPGHEWCGVVSAVGAGADEAWLGVRVTGDTMLGCGRCRRCRAGNGHVCADRHEIGITAWPGALADKVLVARDQPAPAARRRSTTGPARWSSRAATPTGRWRPRRRDRAGASWSAGRARSGCWPSPSPAAAGAEVDVLAADPSRRELAATFGAGGYWAAERSAAGPLRRGHRLHRRPPGSRRRAGAGRAGRAGGLHRRRPAGRARSTAATSCSTTSPRSGSSARRPAWRPPSSSTPTAGSGRARWRRSSSASTGRRMRWPDLSTRRRASRCTSIRGGERSGLSRNYLSYACNAPAIRPGLGGAAGVEPGTVRRKRFL